MGDFNLDILKFEIHPATDDFLDTLGSYFFQPQILISRLELLIIQPH
jgi:hypothetical protein